MDENDVKIFQARAERRTQLSAEQRKLEALENIADDLYGIREALHRIADNCA